MFPNNEVEGSPQAIGTMVVETPQRDTIEEISLSIVLKEVTTNVITTPSKDDANKVDKPQRRRKRSHPHSRMVLCWLSTYMSSRTSNMMKIQAYFVNGFL